MFSGTAQYSHQVGQFFVSSVCLLVLVTMGFPEWTAQFSMWKTTGKNGSEAWKIACQNWAVYSVFPSGMTSHKKIARFNW